MAWNKYRHLGRIAQLRNEGRELLGSDIYWTEKRDGSNVSFWIDADGNFRASSRNMEEIDDEGLINRIVSTAEYEKLFELVGSEENKVFYAELISAGTGPTKIEPQHKVVRLVLFDVFDTAIQEYISYNWLHQMATHHRIPIVKLLSVTQPKTMEELYTTRDGFLKWCKRHRREGVVGKVFGEETHYFKEKIDLPHIKTPGRSKPGEVALPAMPFDKIQSALEQAKAEVERNGGDFRQPKDAMPIVSNHLNAQAREHCFSIPGNYFKYYQMFLEGTLAGVGA